jgi:predicted lactoylglutathione lyase
MIDHVSIGVKDLAAATQFYSALLEILGYRVLKEDAGTVGFGKRYPEFWLNSRPEKTTPDSDQGCHICLRATSAEVVDAFYARAIELGASASGKPGLRPEYHEAYYACFVRDVDQNHIEVVSFLPGDEATA